MRTMFKTAAACVGLMIAVPSMAQMMTASDVGVSPMTGTSATDYVKMAADSDNFEIQSGKIAASRSKREDVKGFGKQMVSDHMTSSKSLMAALTNADRKITPPSMALSADNQAKIALLRKAPKATFDEIYLKQQLESHKTAWALQKGYSTDGTDASLKQVASTVVPVVEQHLSMLKTMVPASSM